MEMVAEFVIKKIECALANEGEKVILEALGELGAQLMAYVAKKKLAAEPPVVSPEKE